MESPCQRALARLGLAALSVLKPELRDRAEAAACGETGADAAAQAATEVERLADLLKIPG